MPTENLWGNLPDARPLRAPVAILRQQAQQLTEQTSGLLNGKVKLEKADVDNLMAFLDIFTPSLNNYVVRILRISHGLHMYPVSVISFLEGNREETASTEEEYLMAVGSVLQSEPVRETISSLLTQVQTLE